MKTYWALEIGAKTDEDDGRLPVTDPLDGDLVTPGLSGEAPNKKPGHNGLLVEPNNFFTRIWLVASLMSGKFEASPRAAPPSKT